MSKNLDRSKGKAVRLHDIYACYSCPMEVRIHCKYRKRAKFMSNLDQWVKCVRERNEFALIHSQI